MTFEQLLGDALHAADSFEPSPDLFAKVTRSIDEDAAHRRRVRRVLAWTAASVVLVGAYVALTLRVAEGVVSMPFAALEILTTALMAGIVVVLGPAIRRFGETYERAVFRSSPDVGAGVLRLLDIAYYLIFGAFIVMTLQFEREVRLGESFAALVSHELDRLGGLLLVMGVLHVLLVVALPVVGLIHAANERRHRLEGGNASIDSGADRIDRAVTIAAWLVAAFVVVQMVAGVLIAVLTVGASG